MEALEIAVERDFFTSFQTVEIPYADERRAFSQVIGSGGYAYDYNVTRVLNESGLNLSDLDPAKRKKSWERVLGCLDDAREAGAASITVNSGPRPAGETDRAEALAALSDSLGRIARQAAASPALVLVIEPMDVTAHKKGTLGYTREGIAICSRLREEGCSTFLLLDTAHMFLNAESPEESLRQGLSVTAGFHYCNCVTDPAHALYGDRHIRFGHPGVLDVTGVAVIMRAQMEMGFFSAERKPPVMCEVLRQDEEQPMAVMDYCIQVLRAAWQEAQANQNQQGG